MLKFITALLVSLPVLASAQTVTANVSGATILVTVSSGPANATDWVALVPASSPDSAHINWMYLNGSKTPPAVGSSSASLQFPAPSSGTYDVRLFANNRLPSIARSATFTIGSGQAQTTTNRIIFNGDSNSSNYYVSGASNWTAIVASSLGLIPTNLSVEGKYASRVLQEVPQMVGSQVCVVMIGTNDMAHAVEVGTPAATALATYRQTMRSILSGLRNTCGRTVILSPVFVMNAREASRYDEWVSALRSLCVEVNATFLDVYGYMKAVSEMTTPEQFDTYYRTPGIDPYHLSAAGHALLAEFVTRSAKWVP